LSLCSRSFVKKTRPEPWNSLEPRFVTMLMPMPPVSCDTSLPPVVTCTSSIAPKS
jgi:hypothetical protein